MKTWLSLKSRGWTILVAWALVCAALFWKPLVALFRFALHSDDASHVLLIPFVTAWLLYLDRRILSQRQKPDPSGAAVLVTPAVVITAVAGLHPLKDPSGQLPAYIFAFILLLTAGFLGVFGRTAARTSMCALGFLLFLVPLPQPLLSRVIYCLQVGSAAVAGFIFDLCGVPALRQGFVFHLPRVSIEVAQECSGIRSSIALLILAVLIAHFVFRTFWKKLVFVAAGLLMMLVKNGIRIATLTILANYVDPRFLSGSLHRDGGIVFFLLGMALMLPVYWLLKEGETQNPRMAEPEPAKP